MIYEVINPQTQQVILSQADMEGTIPILDSGGFLTPDQRKNTRLTKNYFNVTLGNQHIYYCQM